MQDDVFSSRCRPIFAKFTYWALSINSRQPITDPTVLVIYFGVFKHNNFPIEYEQLSLRYSPQVNALSATWWAAHIVNTCFYSNVFAQIRRERRILSSQAPLGTCIFIDE